MAVFSPSQAHRVPSSFLVLVFARRKIFWQPPRMPVTSTCGNTLGPTTASFVLERTIGKSCLECISDLPSVLLRGVEATNSWPSIVLDRLETFRFFNGVLELSLLICYQFTFPSPKNIGLGRSLGRCRPKKGNQFLIGEELDNCFYTECGIVDLIVVGHFDIQELGLSLEYLMIIYFDCFTMHLNLYNLYKSLNC